MNNLQLPMENNPNPVSFYFELSFKGEQTVFQEVTGLSKEMGLEEIAADGENKFKYSLQIFDQNLVLKRALVAVGSLLVNWCTETLGSGWMGTIATAELDLKLMDAKGSVVKGWKFYHAYPVKYAIANLKSANNELVIESIELAYTNSELMDTAVTGYLFD